MARIPLTLGSYQARSIIASAQRCCNLYQEKNPDGSPVPFTYYPCPGLRLLAVPPLPLQARCLYNTTNNSLYAVIGNGVYFVSPTWVFIKVGTITTYTGICSMVDNGTTIVLVDGSPNGYQIDLITRVMTPITAATNGPPPQSLGVYDFQGGVRVDVLDGYIITNDPGLRSFRSTYLNRITWDSLWFALKNGFSDNLVAVVVQKREIWMIGARTTEIWFNAGLSDFPFAIMPGPFIQHGCAAPYSIAAHNGLVYWLSQDQSGKNILARGEGYKATPVSTPAQVTEWSKYPSTQDAIGFCFQQNGHSFYQITFPSADKTWRYDETTQQWHEPVWTDASGNEHRHRANCAAFAYGLNVVGDWENGRLYSLDPEAYTDDGQPMMFERGFPHLVNDGSRVSYPGFMLDMEAGSATQELPRETLNDQTGKAFTDETGDPFLVTGALDPSKNYLAPTPDLPLRAPDGTSLGVFGSPASDGGFEVQLTWSDDRGRTYGNPVTQKSATGNYLGVMQWSRLGMARDRVFRVRGTIPGKFAINGAFLNPAPITWKS